MENEQHESEFESPDISKITDYLYVSSWPREEYVEYVSSLGIRMIISMPFYPPPQEYRDPPFQFVHCKTLDAPSVAIPQFMLRRGVTAALPAIDQGDAVLVHCRQGKHRSVAMACCILVAKGYTSEDAMQLVKEKREVADPYAGYIRKRIEVFESDWLAKKWQDDQS